MATIQADNKRFRTLREWKTSKLATLCSSDYFNKPINLSTLLLKVCRDQPIPLRIPETLYSDSESNRSFLYSDAKGEVRSLMGK